MCEQESLIESEPLLLHGLAVFQVRRLAVASALTGKCVETLEPAARLLFQQGQSNYAKRFAQAPSAEARRLLTEQPVLAKGKQKLAIQPQHRAAALEASQLLARTPETPHGLYVVSGVCAPAGTHALTTSLPCAYMPLLAVI